MTGWLRGAPDRRFFAWTVLIGLVWRLVVSAITPMPREDGVNYLWMAEQFAAGEAGAALSEVFSPLLALVIAVPVACGVEPFTAGQWALAAVGAGVVVPIAKIAEVVHPGAGRSAGLFWVCASRPVLLGAQIYTEPLFLLVASLGFLAGLRRRFLLAGLWFAMAFWVRPEALVLPAALVLGVSRRAWIAWLPLLAGVAVLAIWRGVHGHGFDPVPKLPFILEHNVGARLAWYERLLPVPGKLLEAYGLVAVLAVVGAWRRRPAPLLWIMLFATVIICAYVPRWRFFVNWAFAVLPLAAMAVAGWRHLGVCVAVVVVVEVVLGLRGGSDANRVVEREIAQHLAGRLRPGERIASDMTRVMYFAGLRPLQPRHYQVDELVEAGRGARFLVLRSRRRVSPEDPRRVADLVRAALPGWRPFPLPPRMVDRAEERGMIVLAPGDGVQGPKTGR